MSDKSTKGRAKTEKNRLTRLLKAAGVSEEKIKLLQPVIVNTAMMKSKLDDAQEEIENATLTDDFENGSQSGTRVNPVITAYGSLWKSYMAGMKTILDSISVSAPEIRKAEEKKVQTTLELVRARKKA